MLAVLTASPAAAFVVGLTFGTVRGLAVLLGVRLVSPAALRTFHRRFEALGPASARVTTAVLVGAGLVLAGLVSPTALGAGVVVAVLLLVGSVRPRRAGEVLATPVEASVPGR